MRHPLFLSHQHGPLSCGGCSPSGLPIGRDRPPNVDGRPYRAGQPSARRLPGSEQYAGATPDELCYAGCMDGSGDALRATEALWTSLGGSSRALERLTITGPTHVLPSVYPVTAAATAAVSVATLAAAELWCRRGAEPSVVAVDTRHAALACRSERLLQATDRDLGDLWDPLAGTYATSDGWIRLHTNFSHHRRAACEALGLESDPGGVDRTDFASAVARRDAVDLEVSVHAAGGCAGALRTRQEWHSSPHAQALAEEPLIRIEPFGAMSPDVATDGGRSVAPARPLEGLRVVDLSRALAGPVAGRFLAAYGAEVLRIDAPDGEDGAITVADTTVGKRSAFIDLRDYEGRETFERLVAGADAVICAYRPGALADLRYRASQLTAIRPGLVVGTLSAYGGTGVGDPAWSGRRGFDSLVQMVTGIADEGRNATGVEGPVPLPAQLLDHASGYLLAAGVLTALSHRFAAGEVGSGQEVRVSLARTAIWLDEMDRCGRVDMPDPPDELPDDLTVDLHGPLGHTKHIACPGVIVGAAPHWTSGPVSLGHDSPTWSQVRDES